jgi:hypothetical protein
MRRLTWRWSTWLRWSTQLRFQWRVQEVAQVNMEQDAQVELVA